MTTPPTPLAALITGAGRGIGRATAIELSKRGYLLTLVARSSKELESVVKEIGEDKAFAIAMDLADASKIPGLFLEHQRRWRRLDLLINNAGTIRIEAATQFSIEDWDQIVNVNARATFFCSQQAMKHMKRGGQILNISSLGGISGTTKFPGFSIYAASKFAIVGMTEAMAVEAKPLGIRINCLAPGAVDTKMLRDAAPGIKAEASPEKIAQLIAGICCQSESFSLLNGAVIPVYSNADV